MGKLSSNLTSRKFKKEFDKWLEANPEAKKENKRILSEIGKILDEDISDNKLFYEVIELSPSNHRTKQIVIKAPHDLITLLDRFLLENGIVALKEYYSLRIDYLN